MAGGLTPHREGARYPTLRPLTFTKTRVTWRAAPWPLGVSEWPSDTPRPPANARKATYLMEYTLDWLSAMIRVPKQPK
jgi:hypothetical protein